MDNLSSRNTVAINICESLAGAPVQIGLFVSYNSYRNKPNTFSGGDKRWNAENAASAFTVSETRALIRAGIATVNALTWIRMTTADTTNQSTIDSYAKSQRRYYDHTALITH